jgi:K+-sensing histidine kinase KdpD
MNDISDLFEIETELKTIKVKPSPCVEQLAQFKEAISSMIHDCRSHLSVILSSAELIEHYGHKLTDDSKLERLRHIQQAVTMIAENMERVSPTKRKS